MPKFGTSVSNLQVVLTASSPNEASLARIAAAFSVADQDDVLANYSDMALEIPGPARHLLRHTVATLAYRAQKVLRDAPAGFAGHRLSPASRTPLEIVSHLGDLLEWAERMAHGEYRWAPQPAADWNGACERLFRGLVALDAALETAPLVQFPAEVIFQGPIADALTHVGQLAMIRGVAGIPVRPESYARAEIQVGRVGPEQSTTRKEFDGDASARRA